MSFVVRQNIDRLRTLLRTETDPARRETIGRLLDAEKAKLGHESVTAPRPPEPVEPGSRVGIR
jgi:hypothetical protein